MKQTNKLAFLKRPELIASVLMVVWAFALTAVAFNAPPAGCSPDGCDSPLTVDYTNQTVTVSSAPTATGHVANKEYVDNAVGAAGDATAANQTTIINKVDNSYSACFSYFHNQYDGNPGRCINGNCPSGWTKIGCYVGNSASGSNQITWPASFVASNYTGYYETVQPVCCLAR